MIDEFAEDDLINKLINFVFDKYKLKLTREDPIFMAVILNREVLREFLESINTELRKLPSALETVYIDSIKTLDRDFNNKISLITETHETAIENLKGRIINILSEDVDVQNSFKNLIEETKKTFKSEIDEYVSLYKTDINELKLLTEKIENNISRNAPIKVNKIKIISLVVFLILSMFINIFMCVIYDNAKSNNARLVRIIAYANDRYENNEAIRYIIKKYDRGENYE